MRLLIYNIAYGTGCPGGEAKRLLTMHRYLRTGAWHFEQIAGLVSDLRPDMLGLVEADSGSWRTAGKSHPELVAKLLNEVAQKELPTGSKYAPKSLFNRFPYLKNQTNALLGRTEAEVKAHYFPWGTKRLILEREFDNITVFLVHLGLTRRTRTRQIAFLGEHLPQDRPIVLAGDFNTFNGESELADLKEKLQLVSAGVGATYPAWKPQKQLDYILVSRQIKIERCEILPVLYSDHLPIIADLSL
ncbi:MAG: endonuclease/exonuclease/phosphatase family protein [Victivallales bacterium]|jgi:endonuclease/exonuclease/phosphatase family metal-dependent hydrolase|nr:endonuclease/exonuclease/phosphatase family protein [Victivallales bacterium]